MNTYKRLGELLVAKGLITEEQLQRAMEARQRSNLRLGEVLVSLGFVDEEEITICLAEQYDLKIVNLAAVQPRQEALKLVSSSFALSRLFLPVAVAEGNLLAIVSDPLDIESSDQVIDALHCNLRLMLAPPSKLTEAIAIAYSIPVPRRTALASHSTPPKARKRYKIDEQADRAALLELLNDDPWKAQLKS